MTISEAIRIFLKQSVNSSGLPFRPHLKQPNSDTLKAFNETELTELSGREFKSYLTEMNNEED